MTEFWQNTADDILQIFSYYIYTTNNLKVNLTLEYKLAFLLKLLQY